MMRSGVSMVLGQSAQEQFLRGISDSTSSTVSPWAALAVVGGVAVVVVALLAAQRFKRPAKVTRTTRRPTLRNNRKLLREMARELKLTSEQIRKLEHHADRVGVENALTVLLCPSLLKKDDSAREAA